MLPRSLLLICILLASYVYALDDVLHDEFLYRDQKIRNENQTAPLSTPELRVRDEESLYAEPIRGSIKQGEDQRFSYVVNSSSGVGENYVPLVFLTGNICSQPDDISASANVSLSVYYTFNESALENPEYMYMSTYELGYFSALAPLYQSQNSTPTLYVVVLAPESTNLEDTWTYEIGVSQDDLMHQWDRHPFVEITDTDSNSALVTTKNLTTWPGATLDTYNASLSGFDLLVFDHSYKEHLVTLNNSWCAIRHGPALLNSSDFKLSYTYRGGGLHQQFLVTGLNSSTKYVGVLLQDTQGDSYGGVVYSPFEFETQSTEACSLIYDLEFCDQVAYSVPASSLEGLSDTQALKQVYDDRARNLFTNFSKSLQQIVCNTSRDAIYSPLQTCEACNTSYKNWLCSVTIPRCSTRNVSGYLGRTNADGRNAFINENIKPPLDYYEVLPCLNVCHILVRDCPADFGFACPSINSSISQSYYWDADGEYDTCNFVGMMSVVTSASQVFHIAWSLLIFCVSAAMFL